MSEHSLEKLHQNTNLPGARRFLSGLVSFALERVCWPAFFLWLFLNASVFAAEFFGSVVALRFFRPGFDFPIYPLALSAPKIDSMPAIFLFDI